VIGKAPDRALPFSSTTTMATKYLNSTKWSVIVATPEATTTGIAFFAECLRHSAKAILHSTKTLSSVTLGKDFVECNTRQRILGKYFIGKGFLTLGKVFAVAECFFRQRKTLGKLRIEKIKKKQQNIF
jgi:hypothetical protein